MFSKTLQKFDLRAASETEACEIAALVNKAYRPQGQECGWTHEAALVIGQRISPEQVRALFDSHSVVLVRHANSALVACVHLQINLSCANIGMLATEPACQAQGLGSRMLAVAEQYATQYFSATSFSMSVLADRLELIAFYERRGYCRVGERKAYPLDAGIGQPIAPGMQVETLRKVPTTTIRTSG